MASFTVKDIPDDLYAALKKVAAAHHRSVNREIIYYIEQAVRGVELSPRDLNVDETLEKARQIREKMGDIPLSEELFNENKNKRRP